MSARALAITVREFYQTDYSSSIEVDYKGMASVVRRCKMKSWLNRFFLVLTSIFLPAGYPGSVRKDYMRYQLWDTMQALCSSIAGALSLSSVLRGLGVGNEHASVLAASIIFLFKNGVGLLAQVSVAWLASGHIDSDVKGWRMTADVLNDLCIWLDLMTPSSYSVLYIALMTISSVARAIVGVAGSASRAAIAEHQAICNNLGDVAAKDNAQEAMINFMALLCNLFLVGSIGNNWFLVVLLCAFFTIGHLYSNYMAVQSLQFDLLNEKRFKYLVKSFIESGQVPGVAETNNAESVWPAFITNLFKPRVVIGAQISNFLHRPARHFLITEVYALRSRNDYPHSNMEVHLNKDSTVAIIMEAVFIAYAWMCSHEPKEDDRDTDGNYNIPLEDILQTYDFDRFYSLLGARGWNIDAVAFVIDDWRYELSGHVD